MFFLSLLGSFILTRLVRDFATARGWVANPTQERHLHKNPLPRLGGVAIFISFSFRLGGALLLSCHLPYFHTLSFRVLLTIAVPASLLFLLGVYGDILRAAR